MNNKKKMRILQLGSNKFKLINLTEPLKEDVEVFPGDPKPKKKIFCKFEKENCRHNIYSIGDHNFHPHGDAPNHQNLEYKDRGFEFWNLDYVFNKTCLIDLSESIDSIELDGIKLLKKISKRHILPFINQIRENTALILRTGYDKWLESNKTHIISNIPYISKSAIDIISKIENLRVIGIDSLTIDKVGEKYAHRKLKDRLIVECLVNLYNIPKKNRNCFDLQTSPIAIEGATGGPILAYAYIPLHEEDLK